MDEWYRNTDDVTIAEWLKRAEEEITPVDAELIALQAFAPPGMDRSWLVVHDREVVSGPGLYVAQDMLNRRATMEPMAYVLGYKEFYGREFVVTPSVLIPRPETETLVELIKGLDLPRRPRFLDVGTGSGCIAITLALEFPQSRVVAIDSSAEALDVASQNDLLLEGRVEWAQSDLFKDLTLSEDERNFDVIVANLPYVDPTWEWLDSEALSFEPRTALYVATEHGLAVYKRMFRELQKINAPKARYLVLEADVCQHEELVEFAKKKGYDLLRSDWYGMLFEKRKA